MRVLAVLLLLAIPFAGCVGGDAATGSLDVGYAPFAPVVSENQGAIAGRVVDAGARPLAGASIELPERKVKTVSDPEGRFGFNYLPLGKYTLKVSAQGHTPKSLEVNVRPAEVSNVQFVLAAVSAPVPYVTVQERAMAINFCAADVFGICSNPLTCPQCNWALTFADDPSYFVYEVAGRHTLPKPGGGDALMTSAYRSNTPRTSLWDCRQISLGAPPTCAVLPIKVTLGTEQLDGLEAAAVIHYCELGWVCYDDHYKAYASFFYHTPEDRVKPDYTAIRKS